MNKRSSVYLTGSSGFVGKNIYCFLSKEQFDVQSISRDNHNSFNLPFFNVSDSIIHLAGKAHDLKNISLPDEYYNANTKLTKEIFDAFLASKAKVFITLSSVKAVADEVDGELTEESIPNPITHYGKSKLLAEQYILSKTIPEGKRVYILRPSMIHGPGNKGNLNLLYKLTSKGIPWPLGAYKNKRSFCSVDNLLFIINQLISREDIPSGVYNVADDVPLSTIEIITLIAKSKDRNSRIWHISKKLINLIAKLGDNFSLPLNTERLAKLTQNYIVSNHKLIKAIDMELPVNSKEGMIKTLNSFNAKI
jgi:nucleoside-diphosphate-sugar epimerase